MYNSKQQEILAKYPHLPTWFDPQVFLPHDPMFGRDPEFYPPTDPDMVESHRELVLSGFNKLGESVANLRKNNQFYQELAACEMWTALQLGTALMKLPGGDKIVEQIMIDRKVHQMDKDFSFSKEMHNEPMPSLCGNLERPKVVRS
jgi:hypothetical protein